ncbi:hypothetical protein EON65_03135 [archaeon]|nr:MAG: hypothetical protein EON65_03135 [archaeon]
MMAGCLAVYAVAYVLLKKDNKKIWVPPKPKASLPFGLGPPEEKLKPEDFKETTYYDHEVSLLKESVQQLLTGAAISFFMGMQFKVYMSYLMQSITVPMGLLDNVVLKKYFLGVTKGADGGELYNEQFKQPTVQSIEIAERLAAARASGVGADATTAQVENKDEDEKLTPSVAQSAIPTSEPRVEELNDDADKK